MGTIGVVALALMFAGVVVGAAAWDRTHGRRNEDWTEPTTIPTWAYLMLVLGATLMVLMSLGQRNWLGAAMGAGMGVVVLTRYRRSA